MDGIVSKLRSNRIQSENAKNVLCSKDTTKRHSDITQEAGSKKRILGDITNKSLTRPKAPPPLKSDSSKSNSSSSSSSKGRKGVEQEKSEEKLSLRSSSSQESNDSTSLYTTAIEAACDCPLDVSVFTDVSEKEADKSDISVSSDVIEDYDSTCKGDQFSISEYAADIFRYYNQRERECPILKYLEAQAEISRSMRAILVDWMVEVQESFELNHETLYLAVKLVDYYLMHESVPKAKLQLIGAVAVFVASKYDERLPPLVDDFLYICDDSYTRAEFLSTEIKLLKAVNYDLGFPLSYRFLRRYARCARISMEMLTLARFILETALMDYDLIEHLDSKMAAAALLLGLRMKQATWTPTLEKYTGYKTEDLEEIVTVMNKDISVVPTKHLQTIRTKYSHSIFFEVAKIPPLKL